MELLYSLLLGLVQGITEFLPVSSSGHLLLVGRIVGYTPSVSFEIAAHLGTLVAVLIAYRARLKETITKPLSKPTLVLVLSTAVTAAIVFIFEDTLRATFSGTLLPFAFLLTAVLITASSFVKPKQGKHIGYFEGFIIGVSQAAAVIPGLSRSGTTISTARFLGADSTESADFSFLLSVPIIIVSALSEAIRHFDEFLSENILCLLVGFFAALVSGYFAIRLVLRSIRGGGFRIFAIYLTVTGVLLLLNDLFFHLI